MKAPVALTLFDETPDEERARRDDEAEAERRRYTWDVPIWNARRTGLVEPTGCEAIVEMRTPLGREALGTDSDEPWTEYRGACGSCDWRGDRVDEENDAALDALDHAWPGWRDLPVVDAAWDRNANDSKRSQAALAKIVDAYPDGWLDRGGAPIKTARTSPGNRHVPGYSPWGGYDVAVEPDTGQPAVDDEEA